MQPSPDPSIRICRGVLGVLLAAVALLSTSVSVAAARDQAPNVVLIVSDDQGYRDLGCIDGAEISTPHLDRLAAEGTRLTSFYVAWPACTPSRGAFLTGRYPQRNGIFDMIRNEAPDYGHQYEAEEYAVSFERIGGMDVREYLLPQALQQAGYRTAIFGKWDLGSLRRFLPTSRGFDEFYGFVNTGIDYFTHERYGVPSMYRDEAPTTADRGVCATELFRREALRFIAEHADRPFFLYLPFNAPHNASSLAPDIRAAAQASPEFIEQLRPRFPDAGMQSARRYGQPATVPNRSLRRLRFCASVLEMDAAIGDILDELDTSGLADNTLVIFFSDNGGGGAADNRPLRGRKAQVWEGGIRVPAIVRFPGRVPAGAVRDDFLTSLEVVPTILAATGAAFPDGVKLDGYDMLPTLEHGSPSPRQRMFWKRRGDHAARLGHWKWTSTAQGEGLYDLRSDIRESEDLSESHPVELRAMREAFRDWQQTMQQAAPRGPFRDF